ncbi:MULTISPECIES: SLC13 family permease [Edwardsiella]|uniref:Transporter, divalent anion:Na+ symporter family n=2 Tax=Edwardsiella anguillarum TaxID=1821960 RepID=A0A076LN52_9GAMM|nr:MULTISPECIES: DASS family sodium-coupled anion symporter [Edwardsiella]AIJ07134.1 transporter, divalent anion:Na+ symporter family [Edwardsiella anguillarum ET080813]AKR78498.1 DASS family sodium-coupled anion symporter [Edwardsiella sp. LADL05-105]UOU78254.1 DASS family sodium-coupled anion symporter [Edwardsiella anguillarum]WHP79417.1 DASS family sodium-coupled anion symporter [Edwardsiella anguillarum]WHP83023.1 DASS family sodium-coupled anion symporter [Edwardsiella anguillarum]
MEATPLTAAVASPPSQRGLVIIALDIALLLLLLNTLPFEEKANIGLALTVFIGVLWLTEAVHVTITALLVPLLAIGFGLLDAGGALKSFSNPTIFLFFGGFVLATALHVQGLDRLIANRLLLLAGGRMGRAVLMLFSVTAALSMWISNTATAAMMLPLALGILANLDPARERNTYVFLLLGVAYSASIGGLGTLVGSPPNAIAAAQLGVDFLTWMKFGIPVMVVMMPLMMGLLYLILRPNLKHRVALQVETLEWTLPRLIALVIFGLTVFGWIFSVQLSALLGGIKQFDTLVAVSAAVLIGATGVASWEQIQRNTEWGVLMLFGGGLTLSLILEDSGASAILARGMADIFGHSHWFIILLAVATFIIFLTEFTSNTASAALLVPVFATVAKALGMPESLLTLVIGIGASCAFMLPVATPPNAIVFGSGYIRQREMVRVGFWLNLVSIVALSLFAWFFWR